MKYLYGIVEMDSEKIEILKKNKDEFISMLLQELYFVSGQLKGIETVLGTNHFREENREENSGLQPDGLEHWP